MKNEEKSFMIPNEFQMFIFQVLLAKHKTEEKFYAIKVLHKAAIRKRNEVSCFFVFQISKSCISLAYEFLINFYFVSVI